MVSCTNHPEVTQGLLRCTRCGRPFCPNCVIRLRGFVHCAACKGEQVRDIQSGLAPGQLELATLGRRFGALWIDAIIFFALSMAGTVLLVPLLAAASRGGGPADPTAGIGLMFLISVGVAAVMLVYEGLMLAARGQTLGKMALGIKVVTPEGRDISTGQAWGRSLLRQLFFSYLALVNYLPAAFTKQRTCLHDLIAKTRVIRARS